MANIIDGKAIARRFKDTLKEEVNFLKGRSVKPGLAVVLVGDNPASLVYVKAKGKACEEIGINSFQYTLHKDIAQKELLWQISELNNDAKVHGILVQLPLPDHLDEELILEAISPEKDVDGFHPVNIGRLVIGKPLFQPCTPMGIMKLLEDTGMELAGKDAVVAGRSNIVGKPVALMLLHKNATVTICHSKTLNLREKVKKADILIAAVGRPHMIKGEWIKQEAVVIDVGINRLDNGKLVGDVEFEEAQKRAAFITPVPGGVGPMTIAMLMHNTVEAAKRQSSGYR
ncbi:MAG: bifunctional methylenetetrahydrofolate dehydrogenase/methenyltetrahydrofolate cyclohydrolase FolD [Deltaproteobacteria bacterium]|nr:bifunctional methylenetetrahydrofolate dehydrogenase/methenyltetrahydrofolate cyclohydrolase FolD [Deltaproteobacteria bacterium]